MSLHLCAVYLNQGLFLATQNVLVAIGGLDRGIAGAFEELSLACGHSAVYCCEHNVLNQGCLSLVSFVVLLVLVLVKVQEHSLPLLHNYPLVHRLIHSPCSPH